MAASMAGDILHIGQSQEEMCRPLDLSGLTHTTHVAYLWYLRVY